jgi:hypothetical protein
VIDCEFDGALSADCLSSFANISNAKCRESKLASGYLI